MNRLLLQEVSDLLLLSFWLSFPQGIRCSLALRTIASRDQQESHPGRVAREARGCRMQCRGGC